MKCFARRADLEHKQSGSVILSQTKRQKLNGGIEMDRLITSSPTTLRWLNKIKVEVEERRSSLIYGDSKYWASFKSPETNRNVVYLQPQKKSQIRLFTRLDLSFDNSLQPTPASSGWAEMYPSIFLIRSESAIDKTVELIISSYKEDLHKQGEKYVAASSNSG